MATKNKKKANRKSAPPVETYSVFVSHASTDKWVATKICECIETTGAECFRDDRDIDGGDDIPELIRTAIRDCNELLVLLTPQSVSRDWVRLEMGAAWGLKRRVVVVLHHLSTDPIPDTFKPKKAIQLNDFDDYLAELRTRVKGGEG